MPAVWAALTAVLGNLVVSNIGYWIASALTAFGLHLVAQNFVIEPALDAIKSQMGGLGADGIAWMAYLRVDDMISTILSAYVAAATMSAVRLKKKAAAP